MPFSPPGLRVVQVSSAEDRDSRAFYVDRPCWVGGGRRFVFHRGPTDDGSEPPGMWLCDIEDGCSIRPVREYTEGYDPADPGEGESYGCVLSPVEEALYEMQRRRDRVIVRRLPLNGGSPREVGDAPAPLRSRGVFTISPDGAHLCMGNFLGDGKTEGAPWGGTIFDLEEGEWWNIEFGNGYRNMHCVYGPEPDHSRDLCLQASPARLSDGSWLTPPDGSWRYKDMPPDDGLGCGLTVVRDDGTNWRMVPIGRHEEWKAGGHQVWRGKGGEIAAACYNLPPEEWRSPLLEARPVPASGEELMLGSRMPGASPTDLMRHLPRADVCHFGFDRSGRHFIGDTDGYTRPQHALVYIGTYVEHEHDEPTLDTRFLLHPRTSWEGQPAHPHPRLSPDGRRALIQSDYFGRPQILLAWGYEFP